MSKVFGKGELCPCTLLEIKGGLFIKGGQNVGTKNIFNPRIKMGQLNLIELIIIQLIFQEDLSLKLIVDMGISSMDEIFEYLC